MRAHSAIWGIHCGVLLLLACGLARAEDCTWTTETNVDIYYECQMEDTGSE